ncbi:terminase small subunit [Ensifer canadensis]|uniref:terminase small subunit n=1 Tax=Ensifer canadensis TaxID=555315 RepID=UPI00148F8D3F
MHKLTPRQEAFCHQLAEGRSQRDAYIAAGYSVGTGTTADENACRLAKNDKVSARLADCRGRWRH